MKSFRKILASLIVALILITSVSCANSETATTTLATGPDGNVLAEQPLDLSEVTLENAYGSQLYGYLNRQYYMNGVAVPVAESNFYFIDSFQQLCEYAMYGYYQMTPEGYVDLSAPYMGVGDYATVGDFYVHYAERMLTSTLVLCDKANEQGLALSEETLSQIDGIISSNVTSIASRAGITIDEYLQKYYGPSCNEAVFRDFICRYKLADLYTAEYIDSYDYSDEELYAPNIRYVLISAPESATDEEKAAAEATANEILEASTDLGQLEIQGALAYTNGRATQSDVYVVEPGLSTAAAFEEWANEEHSEGDIDVIYAPEFGYFVVGYEGKAEVSDRRKQDIVVKALGDMVDEEVANGNYVLVSNDPIVPAQPITVETDPVTGMIITPTVAPTGLGIVNTTLGRVVITILGLGVIGAIAFAFFRTKDEKKDDSEESSEESSEEPKEDSKEEAEDEE